ncbi:hypothetical protein Tco_1338735 [Tanacetum coccineum]
MRELREDTFFRNKNDDAHEHVERILDIVSLFNIPGVTHDAVMLRVFPITLTEAAKRSLSSLKKSVTSSRKVMKHCTRPGKGTMTSFTNSQLMTSIAIRSNPDVTSVNFELKENVHAIQVGCQLYGGAHPDKECPLNEEVKSVKEVKYGEFRRSSPFSNGAKYRVGLLRYYTRIDNCSPFGEKRPRLEELMSKHLEESTRRRAEMEEWIKKLHKNMEINTQNPSASLKNLETQIEQLTKEFHAKTASEVPNSLVSQCKAVYANDEAPIDNTSSDETNEVSFIVNNEERVAQEEDDVLTKVLSCQLPPKELNIGSFTLPCCRCIKSLNK